MTRLFVSITPLEAALSSDAEVIVSGTRTSCAFDHGATSRSSRAQLLEQLGG